MIYNNVKERMKEIKKELSKDHKFYLYELSEGIKSNRINFLMFMFFAAVSFFFNTTVGLVFLLISIITFIKMLYDANRFQNIYEREKIKEDE